MGRYLHSTSTVREYSNIVFRLKICCFYSLRLAEIQWCAFEIGWIQTFKTIQSIQLTDLFAAATKTVKNKYVDEKNGKSNPFPQMDWILKCSWIIADILVLWSSGRNKHKNWPEPQHHHSKSVNRVYQVDNLPDFMHKHEASWAWRWPVIHTFTDLQSGRGTFIRETILFFFFFTQHIVIKNKQASVEVSPGLPH